MKHFNIKFRNLILICYLLLPMACRSEKNVKFYEYLNKKDSSANYYLVVQPNNLPVRGLLILIPGFNETPEVVLQQTNLPNLAVENGLLTIIPILKPGRLSFSIDSLSQSSLKEIVETVSKKFELSNSPVYIGGYSIGGSGALKYAELANLFDYKIKPKAVFAIDPPLDFERFYNSSKRIIRLSKHLKPNEEASYMLERVEKEMNGTPESARANYHKISPYSFTDSTQSAIKSLLKTPIRIYSEPDINWWLKERGYDFYNMNAIDAAAMINELNNLGNKDAFLIISENKGFRNPGHKRHPHSWSITDDTELIKWLLLQK